MPQLATGAELRVTGPRDTAAAVVCVNGGQRGEVEGTWSASLEWLVRRLAPRFPRLAFGEVKYRIKSWQRLDWCVEDAQAAIDAMGAPRTLLLGFSMGGAVAVRTADAPSVETVIGLAPWFPDRLSLEPLRGRRLASCTAPSTAGSPGIPGVSPKSSRARLRAGAGARCRRRLHAHPRRGARCRASRALGPAGSAAARGHVGAARRRRAVRFQASAA